MNTSAEVTTPFSTPESRWRAVHDRDQSAIGHFFLGVTTTGIYCRPGCPAKTPHRENVRFFDSAQDARNAGFRACKRCHPDDATPESHNLSLIRTACETIEQAEQPPTLESLAHAAGLSKHHFHRLFKRLTGLTPGQYGRAHRAQRLRNELTTGQSVTDAMYAAGFQSSGRFYASTASTLGMTPSAYREGGAGEQIRFAIATTSLGLLLVAATQKGVCSIAFDDDANTLVEHLRQQFPRARILDADAPFEALVSQVVESIEHPRAHMNIPVDLRGTAFQHRVWNALRQIPPGSTLSYREVAERIDAPGAVRAVASACARNNVAVVVPCHRVIRKSGEMGGYRWGIDRKQALLARERLADDMA